MKDVMLDLETFGNGSDACIVQVGACYFDRNTGEIGEQFKRNVDAESSVKSGAKIDASTVEWWLKQTESARASLVQGYRADVRDALTDFNAFLRPEVLIWSHATFDFMIVHDAFKRLNIKPVYGFKAARDIRTLVDLAHITVSSFPRQGTHHDALDDCLHQVKYCVAAFQKLKKRES